MSTETATTFFALLAVLALVVVVLAAGTAVISKLRGATPQWAVEARAAVAPVALPLAWAVATTSTLGSLYLSEVAKFPPCILCWYQRIAMYPLVVILAVASLRRDRAAKWYVVPLALVGMGISIYHYLIERFPDSVSTVCSDDVPCSTVWVWEFGFLSIPAMAGLGFALVITLVLLAGSSGAPTAAGTRDDLRDDSLPDDSLPDDEIDGPTDEPLPLQETSA
jgi:disulfide bond formation protein DsbB